MFVSSNGCSVRYGWMFLLPMVGVAGSDSLSAADLTNLPNPVREKVSHFATDANKAVIVRTANGPWLVAAASGNASAKAPPVMERDSAKRAAIVEAKRRMAELLSAEIATYVSASADARGRTSLTREVTVAVNGQVLARVQVLEERYDPDAKRCHVIVASAPVGKAVGQDVVFPDADAAAQHLLERCSQQLSSQGVICARIGGSTREKPRLAFIAIAIGPRAANGQHEVSQAKAHGLLTKFWRETLESRVALSQRQIPDPDDPEGSRLLNYDHLETWAETRDASRLPGFKSTNLDRGDVSYTAIWCTN